MRFCTVIASNYLAHARVLAESLAAHHPESPLTVLFIDGPSAGLTEDDGFEVAVPADIGLSGDELRHMAAIYNVIELATAVKPALLAHLLDAHGEPVCYLDPDIEVFGRLDGLEDLAARHAMVLTPHTTVPIPRDGKLMAETVLLLAGMYNLGFIAVSERARPFLDWWGERLRRDCRRAPEIGLFVDQRWVDLALPCFDHIAVTDPGWNVAYWNLHGRAVTHGPDGYLVDGRPLRFFHFSGFSPLEPHRLSRFQGDDPRIRPSEHPAVAQLCARYARKLLAAGYLDNVRRPYRYDFTGSGLPFDGRMRELYRLALQAQEEAEDGPVQLPDPFAPDDTGFLDWLCLPPGDAGMDRIPRYLRHVHATRVDLQVTFPNLTGADGVRFREWIRLYSQSNTDIPPWCLREEADRPEWLPNPPAETPRPGVNVVGYLHAENGVGEVARLLIDSLRHAAIPYATITWDRTPARQGQAPYRSARLPAYDVNVVCVNADQLQGLAGTTVVPDACRTIGIWAWEVSTFPNWMRRSAALVDEIWTYSRHSADAIAAAVDVPVAVFAPPIPSTVPRPVDRSALGLPPGFLFLCSFDYFSVFERKNPLATVAAFCRAFAPGEGPKLVVKTVNAGSHPKEAAQLRAAAGGRSDILFIDGYRSREDQRILMAACDAHVSLHRAEGYGLHLAEAMALGKPVIATRYSGNLEFMSPANSLLVGYRMSTIPLGCMPYPAGGEWAEPDVDEAAALMRELAGDPAAAARLGGRARLDVARHSPAARAPFLLERLMPAEARVS